MLNEGATMTEKFCEACLRYIKSLGWASHCSGKEHQKNLRKYHEIINDQGRG